MKRLYQFYRCTMQAPFMISKLMVHTITLSRMWVWRTMVAESVMGPLRFIWSRGMRMWRTS